MTKIYILSADNSLYRNDRDGYYRGDRGTTPKSVVELCRREQLPHLVMPDTLDFDTKNATRLEKVNFATVDSGVDVLSKEAIDAIESVGDIDWKLVPARFFDDTTGEEICAGRFYGVFFEFHANYFDYEKSDYDLRDWSSIPPEKVSDRMRKMVLIVRKMVLREPKQGFLPCFRLLASSPGLYITEAAYSAIIDKNLKGLKLRESKKIVTI